MPSQLPVLIALPQHDYDPSEAALPWKLLRAAGFEVRFATPDGRPAEADPLMLSGEELDLWGKIPGLRRLPLLGLALRANAEARRAHQLMVADPHFLHPLKHDELDSLSFAGLLLPGGHRAEGMRPFLESTLMQRFVAKCFATDLPVAAVCHGVVLVARSVSSETGRSVLHGRTTTGLTWQLERTAWRLMRVAGRVWDPDYYRTYLEAKGEPAGYRSVQAEVSRAVGPEGAFLDVPREAPHAWRKRSGLFRDTAHDHRAAWVVSDGNFVSARWPGDLHAFTQRFIEVIGVARARPEADADTDAAPSSSERNVSQSPVD